MKAYLSGATHQAEVDMIIRKIIGSFVFVSLIIVSLLTWSPAHAQNTLRRSDSARTQFNPEAKSMRVLEMGRSFRVVDQKNDPVAVTFNQCVSSATETCDYGVKNVTHDEKSGSCKFTCLAAPK